MAPNNEATYHGRMTYVGKSCVRVEDGRLLTGAGRFTADILPDNVAHAVVIRSPHGHARLRDVDLADARCAPGVLGAYSCNDLLADGITTLPCLTQTPPFALPSSDGSPMPVVDQWPLAKDKVRHVGDPVAFVVAQTHAQAIDAAEQIHVDYEPLAAIVAVGQALSPTAERIWDELPGNDCFSFERGDALATQAAFESAAHVCRLEALSSRQIVAFLEPRGVVATYSEKEDRLTIEMGCSSAHQARDLLSAVLGMPKERVRVVSRDVGGAFGGRGRLYHEYALMGWAARKLRQPVRWIADRSESFTTDTQARDQCMLGELALDAEGNFLALKVTSTWRHGAYLPGNAVWVLLDHMTPMICGVYKIPTAHIRIEGVFSNTASVAPFRGVARAEPAYLIERLVDTAAREFGMDRLMLREKNIVRPSMMPWTTPVNSTYYEGDFGANLTLALEAMNWKDFENRRRSSSPPGTARGIGCSVYVENSGGALSEFADVRFERGGTVVAYVGTGSSGMGIETSFAQVLADELGLKRESIRIVQGDTDKVARGFGSHGSRSMRIGGNAVRQAAKELVEEGQQLAAEMLQHSVGEIVFARGEFFAETSPDQRIDWAAVALHAQTNVDALRACVDYAVTKPSYPNGCHACEVEVDLETGVVRLLRFVMVKDVGYAINPLIVHGQMHGGIAQGVGQALFERVVYEEESGQLLSGSFLDYALPRADDLPPLETHINEQFSAENPLGVKGAGEGGTTGAPPAVVNAVLDALAPIGVTDLEMPLIPERVWRAIEFAKRT